LPENETGYFFLELRSLLFTVEYKHTSKNAVKTNGKIFSDLNSFLFCIAGRQQK